jgi:hypothetical protein
VNAQTRSILQVQLDYQLRCAEGNEGKAAALQAQADDHRAQANAHRQQARDIERSLRVLDAVFGAEHPDQARAIEDAAAGNGEGAAGESSEPAYGDAPAA